MGTWDQARAACKALFSNADLVVINNAAEFTFIQGYVLSVLKSDFGPWMGGSATVIKDFSWLNGVKISNNDPIWGPGEIP